MAFPTQRMSLAGGAQNDSSEGVKFCKDRLDLCCKRPGSVARVHGDCWRVFLSHEVHHGPGEDGAALQLREERLGEGVQ